MTHVSFGSDNHSGVHPALMEEIVKVNVNDCPSYEQDVWSQKLKKEIKRVFKAEDSAMVFNGTAANVIALQLGLRSYHSVICTDCSHLNLDECGAPEKIAGVKLITLPQKNGKLSAESIRSVIVRRGDQHHSQVKMVSITQPTEYGTVYSLDEVSEIRKICDQEGLYLHIDGARLANAAVHLQSDFLSLTQHADLLSFGGAKNGLMMGEFVVVRNLALTEGLRYIRKQSLQLPAKTRFLSAPFLKYLEGGLWQEIAEHENSMATHLREGIESTGLTITMPTQANSVFCIMPKALVKSLRKKFFFYVWDESEFEVRLMTHFSTDKKQIDDFVQEIHNTLK